MKIYISMFIKVPIASANHCVQNRKDVLTLSEDWGGVVFEPTWLFPGPLTGPALTVTLSHRGQHGAGFAWAGDLTGAWWSLEVGDCLDGDHVGGVKGDRYECVAGVG